MVGFKSVFLAYFEDISFAFYSNSICMEKLIEKQELWENVLFDIFIMRIINSLIFWF